MFEEPPIDGRTPPPPPDFSPEIKDHRDRNRRYPWHSLNHERHNNWQSMIAGAAVGFAVRYSLRAAFAVAAAHVTVPAMAAIPIALFSAALIGAVVKIAVVAATTRQRPQGWLKRAVIEGAAAGFLGGVAGDLIAEFGPVHDIAHYISHRFFPAAAPLAVATAAPSPPPTPTIDPGVKDDIQRVLHSRMLRHSPHLRALGEKALQSNNPKAVLHFCKEASYKLINGGYGAHAKTLGAGLIRDGVTTADTFSIQDHTSMQLNADEAYMKLYGLFGETRDITGSTVNAQRAGHLGERFLKLAIKLQKPAIA